MFSAAEHAHTALTNEVNVASNSLVHTFACITFKIHLCHMMSYLLIHCAINNW